MTIFWLKVNTKAKISSKMSNFTTQLCHKGENKFNILIDEVHITYQRLSHFKA